MRDCSRRAVLSATMTFGATEASAVVCAPRPRGVVRAGCAAERTTVRGQNRWG
jgi:hypothetical protein